MPPDAPVSDEFQPLASVAVADLLPGFGNPWETWEEAEHDIRSRLCLCCSQPGHYQETVERHVAEHGICGLAVCVEDGRVHDGHHRVLAARRHGIERLPVESMDEAGARWVRDHGPVDWTRRRIGDMTRGEASWVVTDALMKSFGTPQMAAESDSSPHDGGGIDADR